MIYCVPGLRLRRHIKVCSRADRRSGLTDVDADTEQYLQSEDEIGRSCYSLLDSKLFNANEDYIRRQVVAALLQVNEIVLIETGRGPNRPPGR